MADEGRAEKRAWGVATLAGVAVVAGVILLFRVSAPAPAITPAGGPKSSVGLVALGRGRDADPLLTERAELFDPTPLFLPTEWNSAHKSFVLNEPGGASHPYPDEPTFTASALTLDLPSPTEMPRSPADALEGDPPSAPFLGFGQADLPVDRLEVRDACVEIVEAGSGRRVFARPLTDVHPPGSASWQPMEFLAAVDAAGLVGPLVQTLRSGTEPVDSFFRHYLADTFRIGSRLQPGFYRITVGP